MSRPSRIAVGNRLSWVMENNPNPMDEELQRPHRELEMTHLDPAVTAIQSSTQSEEQVEEPK
jgi:hypothetical protein